jgi:hypothetical protein
MLRRFNKLLTKLTGLKLVKTRDMRAMREKLRRFSEARLLPFPHNEHRIRTLARLLKPQRALGYTKVRTGGRNDGGYVCLDDFADTSAALSFGIGHEISWDLDMAGRGITVFQYDHTIVAPPAAHPNFRFFRERVTAEDGDAASIPAILARHEISKPGSAILKIDVEGDEWPIFAALPEDQFRCVSQIICEFHDFWNAANRDWFERAEIVLRKLNKSFAVVHVHANNYAPMLIAGTAAFPNVLEVTFASRARYSFTETDEEFPNGLDRPNDKDQPDYFLSRFHY